MYIKAEMLIGLKSRQIQMAGRSFWLYGILLLTGCLAGCFDDDEPAADTSVIVEDLGAPGEDVVEPLPDHIPVPNDTFVVVEDEGSPAPDIVEPEPDLSSGPEDVLVVEDEGSPAPDIVEPEPDLSSGPEDVLVVEDEGSPAPDIVEPEPDLSSGPEDVLVVVDEGPEPECVSDVDCVTEDGCNDPKVCGPLGFCEVGPFYAVSMINDVTLNALAAGDVVINGVVIGATSSTDDTVSVSGNNASAIAKAAVINEFSEATGVYVAPVMTTLEDTISVTAGHIVEGELIINGLEIAPTIVLANDADNALRSAINAVSPLTGVVASVGMMNQLVLRAPDGRNIVVGGLDPTGGGITGLATETRVSGLEVWSRKNFTITGAMPENLGVFPGSPVMTVINTAAVMPCFDGDPCTLDSCDNETGSCVNDLYASCEIETPSTCTSDADCVTDQGCNEPMVCGEIGTCVPGPFYAIIVASSVTDQPMQSGDLVINGVNMGPSLAEDDPGSYSGNDVSAIAKAAAINKWSDLTGVTALVTLNEPNFWDGTPVAAGMLLPGDLNVNGVEVPATIFLDSDADSSLRDALNSLSSETGVFASVNMAGGLVLTEVQRRNMEIGGANPSIGGAIGLSPGIYTGGIELSSTWSEGISINGVNPSAIGMAAGITVPNAFAAVPCVDGVACTSDSCDLETGTCLHEFMEFTIGCGIP